MYPGVGAVSEMAKISTRVWNVPDTPTSDTRVRYRATMPKESGTRGGGQVGDTRVRRVIADTLDTLAGR